MDTILISGKIILFFDRVIKDLFDQGGDGDQTIVTTDVENASILFDAYLEVQKKYGYLNKITNRYTLDFEKIMCNPGNITYQDNQESISIVTIRGYMALPPWCTEISCTHNFETLTHNYDITK